MIVDILEEHLEEADILIGRRHDALWSERFDLESLAELEERLDAHLDGLLLGGKDGWPELQRALGADDADRAFAASAALLRGGEHGRVLEALGRAGPEPASGIVEALCYVKLSDEAQRTLRSWMTSAEPQRVAAALEVLSFHRCLEPRTTITFSGSDDAAVRRAAAVAAGRVGAEAPLLERLMDDESAEARESAFMSAIRLGHTLAIERIRAMCRTRDLCTPRLLWLLGAVGERGDVVLVSGAALVPSLAEAALAALGTLGSIDAVPRLLELMCDPCWARGAGAAFTRITGILPPEKVGDGSTIEEEAMFQDLRPVPDAAAARERWHQRSRDFDPRTRWRNGQPLTNGDWRRLPHRSDLLTRREELTRLWSREPALFPSLELDFPASRQRAAA